MRPGKVCSLFHLHNALPGALESECVWAPRQAPREGRRGGGTPGHPSFLLLQLLRTTGSGLDPSHTVASPLRLLCEVRAMIPTFPGSWGAASRSCVSQLILPLRSANP